MEDVDYILSEIQQEIVSGPNSIRVQAENQILTGDGTGENHKGLFTYATPFAKPTGFNTMAAPTMYDAAMASVLQVTKANFTPDYLLVNPSDMLNMQLTKDSQGNYIMPPFIGQNGMVIGGVRVAANNRVAEGSYLVGDMKRATLFMKRQLTLKFFDQNEDDDPQRPPHHYRLTPGHLPGQKAPIPRRLSRVRSQPRKRAITTV